MGKGKLLSVIAEHQGMKEREPLEEGSVSRVSR